jgi:cytochrome c peroxidase
LFTNERVRALANAVRTGQSPLPDPDPKLTPLETQGKAVFGRSCAVCHGGPGQSLTPLPVPFRFGGINTQCPRAIDTVMPARWSFAPCPQRLVRNAQTFEITLANGAKVRRLSSDPGRALITGFIGGPPPGDDWEKLDVPGLRGIRNTAPYFHNNSAATLSDVVDHYVQFFNFVRANAPPGTVPPIASTDGINFDRQPRPEERAALLAYLRRL